MFSNYYQSCRILFLSRTGQLLCLFYALIAITCYEGCKTLFVSVAFSTTFAGYFFIYLNVSRSSIVFSLFAFVEFLHQLPVVPRWGNVGHQRLELVCKCAVICLLFRLFLTTIEWYPKMHLVSCCIITANVTYRDRHIVTDGRSGVRSRDYQNFSDGWITKFS